jgi:hypothetical protein
MLLSLLAGQGSDVFTGNGVLLTKTLRDEVFDGVALKCPMSNNNYSE